MGGDQESGDFGRGSGEIRAREGRCKGLERGEGESHDELTSSPLAEIRAICPSGPDAVRALEI